MGNPQAILTLPLPPKQLHAHNNGYWRSKSRATREYREASALYCKAQRFEPMREAVLSIDFFWPTRARRDLLNACQGLKPAIDGIVDAGLIPDDNWTVLGVGHIRPHIDRDNPRVVLTITETSESNP